MSGQDGSAAEVHMDWLVVRQNLNWNQMPLNLSLEPTRAALYVTNVGSRDDRESLRRGAVPGACGSVLRYAKTPA